LRSFEVERIFAVPPGVGGQKCKKLKNKKTKLPLVFHENFRAALPRKKIKIEAVIRSDDFFFA
jgi:hypothetical protein